MSDVAATDPLTPRWYPLRYHREQARIWDSEARFKVIVAGARSGKTESAKRVAVTRILRHVVDHPHHPRGQYIFGAPTQDQAERVFWDELQELFPPWSVAEVRRSRPPSILLQEVLGGTRVRVIGFDKIQRAEGQPVHGIVADEFSECKPSTWKHLRPMVSTVGQEGWIMIVSRPRQAKHLKRLFDAAPTRDGWDAFHWTSEEILSAEEIAAAKEELDPLEYEAEYLGRFVNYQGRAYHAFDRARHVTDSLPYARAAPISVCFDFNVDPGVAVVAQEMVARCPDGVRRRVTGVLGEVYIPRNSTTEAVCRRLLADWGDHEGEVRLYGDATGGARRSSGLHGTDWDIVREMLAQTYRDRLVYAVPRENPPQRVRLNAVNRRLQTADGEIHLLVDGVSAPRTVDDFEDVILLEGGSGELDKRRDLSVSHLTDALGYYISEAFPLAVDRLESLVY